MDDVGGEAPDASKSGVSLSPAALAFFKGETRRSSRAVDDRNAEPVIEVLECNWIAVQVYRACQWTIHVGMTTRPYFQGISCAEIMAGMQSECVPRRQWSDTRRRVRIMANAASQVLNKS